MLGSFGQCRLHKKLKATLGTLVGCYFKINPKRLGVYLSGTVSALDLCKALYSAKGRRLGVWLSE